MLDFAIITDHAPFRARCQALCEDYKYVMQAWAEPAPLLEELRKNPDLSPTFILLSATHARNCANAAQITQSVHKASPHSFIACVLPKSLRSDDISVVKTSGASAVLLEEEVLKTSKLEFFGTQVIRSAYIPIKATDLSATDPVTFHVYHLLPQRGKFLPCLFPGDSPTPDKLKKITAVGEMYVKRSEIDAFNTFCQAGNDKNEEAHARRCRASFLALQASFAQLVLLLTDQAERSSFTKGQTLYEKCKLLTQELAIALSVVGDAWGTINNSTIGESGSLERTPAIAAYGAVLAFTMGTESIENVMLSAVLADISLLLIPPTILRKIRESRQGELTAEERELYESHPLRSVTLALDRKLPVDDYIRKVILCSHENFDGTGFPNKLSGRNVLSSAQLIHFCELLDKETALNFGKARAESAEFRKAFMANAIPPGAFDPEILEKIKKAL